MGVVFVFVVSVDVMMYGSVVCCAVVRCGQGISQASILSEMVALA